MLIAQLPKELAVEEAIVAMLAAMSTRSDDEEKLLEDEGEQNTGENAKVMHRTAA